MENMTRAKESAREIAEEAHIRYCWRLGHDCTKHLDDIDILTKRIEDYGNYRAKEVQQTEELERWACCGMIRNEIHGDYCPRCS